MSRDTEAKYTYLPSRTRRVVATAAASTTPPQSTTISTIANGHSMHILASFPLASVRGLAAANLQLHNRRLWLSMTAHAVAITVLYFCASGALTAVGATHAPNALDWMWRMYVSAIVTSTLVNSASSRLNTADFFYARPYAADRAHYMQFKVHHSLGAAAFGTIALIPPPNSDVLERDNDALGYRYPFMPFFLRTIADDRWRESVAWLLRWSRGAIIECTSASPSLLWEVDQIARRHPPRRVLLLVKSGAESGAVAPILGVLRKAWSETGEPLFNPTQLAVNIDVPSRPDNAFTPAVQKWAATALQEAPHSRRLQTAAYYALALMRGVGDALGVGVRGCAAWFLAALFIDLW